MSADLASAAAPAPSSVTPVAPTHLRSSSSAQALLAPDDAGQQSQSSLIRSESAEAIGIGQTPTPPLPTEQPTRSQPINLTHRAGSARRPTKAASSSSTTHRPSSAYPTKQQQQQRRPLPQPPSPSKGQLALHGSFASSSSSTKPSNVDAPVNEATISTPTIRPRPLKPTSARSSGRTTPELIPHPPPPSSQSIDTPINDLNSLAAVGNGLSISGPPSARVRPNSAVKGATSEFYFVNATAAPLTPRTNTGRQPPESADGHENFAPTATLAAASSSAQSTPFDMQAELYKVFDSAGLPPAYQKQHLRRTNAAKRAWSVQSKIVRPSGVKNTLRPEESELPGPEDELTLRNSSSGYFRTPLQPPAPTSTSVASSRPSTAASSIYQQSTESSPRHSNVSPSRSPSSSPRPISAVPSNSSSPRHRPPSAIRYSSHLPGAPPSTIPTSSPLLGEETGLFHGSPEKQIKEIYARAKHRSEAAFEEQQAETAKKTSTTFVPPIGLDLYVGKGKYQAVEDEADKTDPFLQKRSQSATRKAVHLDIMTGESKEVEIVVRDEDDDESSIGDGESDDRVLESFPPSSPSSSVIVQGQGGHFTFRGDQPPELFTKEEDTFRDHSLYKSARLRQQQLEREDKRATAAGMALDNPGNQASWKSYHDYGMKNLTQGKLPEALDKEAELASLATGTPRPITAFAPSTTQPTVIHPRNPDKFYPSNFVPAHMMSEIDVARLTGAPIPQLTDPIATTTLGGAPPKTIGDFGSVRPLSAVQSGVKKSANRIRLENAHEERLRQLEFAQMTMKTMNHLPIDSIVAPIEITPEHAEPSASPRLSAAESIALRTAAKLQKRHLSGMRYHTAAFRASVMDNGVQKVRPVSGITSARQRPATAGSAYSQRNLARSRPTSAYSEYQEPQEPKQRRPVGRVSTKETNWNTSEGVALRLEQAARKAEAMKLSLHLSGKIDINGANEAMRAEELYREEMNRPMKPMTMSSHGFRIHIGTTIPAPSSSPSASPRPVTHVSSTPKPPPARPEKYFGNKRAIRKIHGQARKKAAQAQAAAAVERAAQERQAAMEQPAAATTSERPPPQDSPKQVRFQTEDGTVLPEEEKSNDLANVEPAVAPQTPAFPANSTRTSRLRYLASPRVAHLLANQPYIPSRAPFGASQTPHVRLANSVGSQFTYDASTNLLAFEPHQGWASSPVEQLLSEMPHPQVRRVIVSPPDATPISVKLDQISAAKSSPRVQHIVPTVAMNTNVDTSLPTRPSTIRPSTSGSNSARGSLRGSNSVVNETTILLDSTSTSVNPFLAQVPLTARHDYDTPQSSMRATNLQEPNIATTTAIPSATSIQRPPSSGPQIRTLKVVSFNELPSTQTKVFSALAHHPNDARLYNGMWTPASLITSSATH